MFSWSEHTRRNDLVANCNLQIATCRMMHPCGELSNWSLNYVRVVTDNFHLWYIVSRLILFCFIYLRIPRYQIHIIYSFKKTIHNLNNYNSLFRWIILVINIVKLMTSIRCVTAWAAAIFLMIWSIFAQYMYSLSDFPLLKPWSHLFLLVLVVSFSLRRHSGWLIMLGHS